MLQGRKDTRQQHHTYDQNALELGSCPPLAAFQSEKGEHHNSRGIGYGNVEKIVVDRSDQVTCVDGSENDSWTISCKP